LGLALSGRETPDRRETLGSPDRVADERRLAAIAYFVWPAALYEAVAPRAEASSWYRFQMRQALWFGVLASVVGLAALLWPLLATFLVTNVTATIWLYVLALLIDLGLLVLWLVLAARYSRRAGNGELFDVPWVVRLTGAASHKR
jgi:MFS family permease